MARGHLGFFYLIASIIYLISPIEDDIINNFLLSKLIACFLMLTFGSFFTVLPDYDRRKFIRLLIFWPLDVRGGFSHRSYRSHSISTVFLALIYSTLISVALYFLIEVEALNQSFKSISNFIRPLLSYFGLSLASISLNLNLFFLNLVFICCLGVLTHLIADLLTYMGIPLLYPLTSRKFSFKLFKSDNRLVNNLFSLLGWAFFFLYLIA